MALATITSLVAQAAHPSCPITTESVCYRNPGQLLATVKVKDAWACCSQCQSEAHCLSFTFWGGDQCHLFSGGAAGKTSGECVSGVKQRMNFVYMFPDTLRAESFSSYGNPLQTTPNLDAFAKTGVRFEQAHVQHTQCTPSRVAMLTGRYMHVLGHRTQTHLIQPYEFNYFRTLKETGYHVQYYGKNDVFSADAMNRSVSEWSPDIGVVSGGNAFKYGEAGYYSMLSTGSNVSKDDHKNKDYLAVVKASQWMKEEPPEPFLLFLSGRGAHPPYGSPAEFNEKWSVDEVRDKITLRPPYGEGKPKYHSRDAGVPHYRNLTALAPETFYKIQATYLGMISYTDWIFGELLRGIDEAGLTNTTAVFFSSDHGDFAGDFNMIEKWPGGADDVLTRVPLFARIPGGAAGAVVRAPVSLFDVPHTICALAGIDVTGDGSGPHGINYGVDLSRQLRTGAEADLARFVYSEGGFSFRNELFPMGSDHVPDDPKGMYWPRAQEEMSDDGNGSPKWAMRRNLTHKLVYRPRGESELYDLGADPRELTNLWASAAAAALRSEMVAGLTEWLLQTSDATPMHTDPRGPPAYPHPASACASTDDVVGPADAALLGEGRDIPANDYLAINGVEGFV